MYKIIFFVPSSHLEQVKKAIFDAGAGKCTNYKDCSWQVLGEGQFFAYNQAEPYIGKKNELTQSPEYYVEVFCPPECIELAITALKKSHPFEAPAYQVIKLELF